MTETKEQRLRVFYPPETWHAIKVKACKGITFSSLSNDYGMSRQCISQRAKAEKWPIPKRVKATLREVAERDKAAADESKCALASSPGSEKSGITQPDCVNPALAVLRNLAEADPTAYQSALAGYLEGLMIKGLETLEPPKSIREAATLQDMIRKGRGLDKDSGKGGPAPLVDVSRRVSRRAGALTVEAEPVTDAPDPGSAEFAEWEV